MKEQPRSLYPSFEMTLMQVGMLPMLTDCKCFSDDDANTVISIFLDMTTIPHDMPQLLCASHDQRL